MKTSYFAKYRGPNGVSIALKTPPGFKGGFYPKLAPMPWILAEYKQTGDEQAFREAYEREVLQHVDPFTVWEDLKEKVLLCWEGPGKFCHRRLVAEWLENNLGCDFPGISIPEA